MTLKPRFAAWAICGIAILVSWLWTTESQDPERVDASSNRYPMHKLLRANEDSGGVPVGSVFMLADDAVRRELRLTPAQTAALDQLISAYFRDFRQTTRDVAARDLSSLADAGAVEAVRRKRRDIREQYRHGAESVLTSPQRKRLEQIDRQMRGSSLFSDAKFLLQLGISGQGWGELREIDAAASEKLRSLSRRLRVKRLSRQEHARLKQALEDERKRDMVAALSDEERKAYEQLVGAPVAFDRSQVILGLRVSEGHDPQFVSPLERRFQEIADAKGLGGRTEANSTAEQ